MICDLAETYGILDYRSHPLKLIATLAYGLRDDSRIKMEMAGVPADEQTLLLTRISDQLTCAYWSDKRNKPVLLTEKLFGMEDQEEISDIIGFETAEAFEEKRKEILEKVVE